MLFFFSFSFSFFFQKFSTKMNSKTKREKENKSISKFISKKTIQKKTIKTKTKKKMKSSIENPEDLITSTNAKRQLRLEHSQNRRQKIRRKTLLVDTNPKKHQPIEEKISETDEIKEIKEEIDNLQNEIKLSRDKCNKMMKDQQQMKTFVETLKSQRKTMKDIEENFSGIVNRDKGSRQDVEECGQFMSNLIIQCYDHFCDEMRSIESIFVPMKNFLNESNNYVDLRNQFDKYISQYSQIDANLTKLNKEKRPDIKRIGQLQLQKTETFNSIKTEGEKVTEMYIDLYNQFLTIVLKHSVNLSDKVMKGVDEKERMFKDTGEKLDLWKSLNLGEAVKSKDVQYPEWMSEMNVFISIMEEEQRFVENMELCVNVYAKSILCNPTLATTGLSIDDINIIFSDIETIHILHENLVKELKNSTSETFISIFKSKMNEIYQIHKRRCEMYKESMKKYNECLQIPLFKDAIESIYNSHDNKDEMKKLEELLTDSIEQSLRLLPLFNAIKTEYPEYEEDVDKLCIIFDSLSLACTEAKKVYEVESQLIKITFTSQDNQSSKGNDEDQTKVNTNVQLLSKQQNEKKMKLIYETISNNKQRKYKDRQQCHANKQQGVMFKFSDIMIFTTQQKNEYLYEFTIDGKLIKSFETSKKSISIHLKEKTIDLKFNDSQNVEKFANYLSEMKSKFDKTKIYGTEIKQATASRNEEMFIYPQILHKMFDKLEKEAPETDGIFRLSVSVKELEQTMDLIDCDVNYDISQINVHVIANCLKKYLNFLKNKLPLELQEIDVNDISEMKRVLMTIKESNPTYLYFIERLFRMLNLISQHSEINRMTCDNLAIVISPNVFEETNSFTMDFEKEKKPCVSLIKNYDEIFKEIRSEFEQLFEEKMNISLIQKNLEEEIQKQTNVKEIPISKIVEGREDDKSAVLALKDIVKQGYCEMLEGKKWVSRWIVAKKNCLLIFKSMGDGQAKNIFHFDGMNLNGIDNKYEKDCFVLKVGKDIFYLAFEDNEDWAGVIKASI